MLDLLELLTFFLIFGLKQHRTWSKIIVICLTLGLCAAHQTDIMAKCAVDTHVHCVRAEVALSCSNSTGGIF